MASPVTASGSVQQRKSWLQQEQAEQCKLEFSYFSADRSVKRCTIDTLDEHLYTQKMLPSALRVPNKPLYTLRVQKSPYDLRVQKPHCTLQVQKPPWILTKHTVYTTTMGPSYVIEEKDVEAKKLIQEYHQEKARVAQDKSHMVSHQMAAHKKLAEIASVYREYGNTLTSTAKNHLTDVAIALEELTKEVIGLKEKSSVVRMFEHSEQKRSLSIEEIKQYIHLCNTSNTCYTHTINILSRIIQEHPCLSSKIRVVIDRVSKQQREDVVAKYGLLLNVLCQRAEKMQSDIDGLADSLLAENDLAENDMLFYRGLFEEITASGTHPDDKRLPENAFTQEWLDTIKQLKALEKLEEAKARRLGRKHKQRAMVEERRSKEMFQPESDSETEAIGFSNDSSRIKRRKKNACE